MKQSSLNQDAASDDIEQSTVRETLTGYPTSPGIALGPCMVLSTLDDVGKVRENAILVCETASPKLAIIMPRLRGLVTAQGGTLIPAAEYARDYRVPAVFGVGPLSETIHDGDVLRVDGTNGIVELIMKKNQANLKVEK